MDTGKNAFAKININLVLTSQFIIINFYALSLHIRIIKVLNFKIHCYIYQLSYSLPIF